MEPRIRFARASDGVAVAYWTAGFGVPVVHMPWLPWSHAQLEWRNPEMNRWYEAISAGATLVRYDVRGTGLSDRHPQDMSIEAQIRDLEAVVEALDAERFLLFGVHNSSPAALVYASRNPPRLGGLVLWCAYANGQQYYSSPRVASIRALIDDWELYTETGAHAFIGWDAGPAAHELAKLMREAVDADLARRFLAEMRDVDCYGCLSSIKVPTLVLHPRRFPLINIELARAIASGVPDGRLVALEGESLAPTRVNLDAAVQAIFEMLPPLEPAGSTRREPLLSSTARAADAAAATGLTQREIEVVRMVAAGLNSREIAERLVLSPRTVERHIANIYAKVNVNNRAQLTAFAISNGLVGEL